MRRLRAVLRPLLLRAIARLTVAIAVAMPIAPAAPLLFAFRDRLLACIGEPALGTMRLLWLLLLSRLLWLLRPRRSLFLVSLAAGAGTVSLRAARLLARPAIAAAVAPAMSITIGAAAIATVVTIARALLSRSGLRTSGLLGCATRGWARFLRWDDWSFGSLGREPAQDLAEEAA